MLYQIETREDPFTATLIQRLLPLPHIHPHLELIYIKSGSSIATLDNKKYQLNAGDLFLSFPNQIHFYHDVVPPTGYMLIFAPNQLTDLNNIFQTQSPCSPIITADKLPADIEVQLEKIHTRLQSASAFDHLSAKGCLLSLMCELLSQMTLIDAPASQDNIKRLLTYCTEHYTEPLTLEILSKNLHLNKYYISHIFQERMSISYKDFINSLRVEYACSLLTKDTAITDVAYASGFSTIRTFNRAFLKHAGMTPREYVKGDYQAAEIATIDSYNINKKTSLSCLDRT